MMAANDYEPNVYQDDINTDPEATDPLQEELSENPADELGVPEDEYGEEFNDPERFDDESDDALNDTEDLDEDAGDDTKTV